MPKRPYFVGLPLAGDPPEIVIRLEEADEKYKATFSRWNNTIIDQYRQIRNTKKNRGQMDKEVAASSAVEMGKRKRAKIDY